MAFCAKVLLSDLDLGGSSTGVNGPRASQTTGHLFAVFATVLQQFVDPTHFFLGHLIELGGSALGIVRLDEQLADEVARFAYGAHVGSVNRSAVLGRKGARLDQAGIHLAA